MALDQVAQELIEIKKLVEKIAAGDREADWGCLLERYEKINSCSDENDWTSMHDAAVVAEALIQQMVTGEATDPSQNASFVDSINSAIERLIGDIKENGRVTISIKGAIAEAKLFLGDFDYIAPAGEAEKDDDADHGGIDIFNEFNKRVTNIENLVMEMDETSYDEESIITIFREYHTLKGEAGFTGLGELSNFCHKVESSIEPLRHRKIRLTQEIIDLMLYLSDQCKLYIESAKKSTPLPDEAEIDNNIDLLQTQIAEADEFTGSTEAPPEEVPESQEEEGSEFASFFPLDDEEEALSEKPDDAPTEDIPETEATREQDSQEPPSREVKKPSTLNNAPKGADSRKMDLGLGMIKVDALVEIAGELTILYQTITQSPEINECASNRLTNDLEAMGRLFKDLQALVMSIRMTSIGPLFQRLNRIIRDSSRQEKKLVEVKMTGTNTIIDKTLLEDISGALVHIVRNAVGHGIEPPRERIKAGKMEKGTVSLRAFRDANNIVIEVSDDGKGISKEKVLNLAMEKGLIDSKEGLDDENIYDLLFLPGFSTADKVTDLSGRGVGMDVVKSSIEKVRGRIEIRSDEGKGTKTRLVLPFTFAIIEGLVVRIAKDFFVLPLAQVHEMGKLQPEHVMRMKGQAEFVDIRGKLLPLVRLHHLFGDDNGREEDDSDAPGVLVSIEHDHKMCALLVDEVVASQEIVLKELKGSFSHLDYISAAGILGNRRIGLVLDVGEITDDIYSRVDINQVNAGTVKKREQGQVEIIEIGTNKVAMIDFFVEFGFNGKQQKLRLAINAFKTKEFIAKSDTIMLPRAPRGFSGMLTLRGKTVPVFSLSKLLMPHLTDDDLKERLIIICEFSKKEIGFLVSGVNKVNYISWTDILPPPNSNNLVRIQNIVGTILEKEDVIFILDFEKLIESVMVLYDSLDKKGNAIKTRKPRNTILLVEDSNLMRKKIKESLEKVGMTIIEAANGKEGLDLIDNYYEEAKKTNGSIFDYIDLVLTDIEMPQLDGYTLTKTIKAHPELRVLPVLLHSSLSNETIIQRAKEVRADGFITKCDPDSIYSSLEKYL